MEIGEIYLIKVRVFMKQFINKNKYKIIKDFTYINKSLFYTK